MSTELIYVHDPMCSWCYAFEPLRRELVAALDGRLPVRRLLGGLAPDSDLPMPMAMRNSLEQTWQRIEQVVPGTRFNFDFWRDCEPRRSTYPSNRAVIAARRQNADCDGRMTNRIQQAYYQEARNPSDDSTLIDLAVELGLERERFAQDLVAEETRREHMDEMMQARALGIDSFPSLAVLHGGVPRHLALTYTELDFLLEQIETITESLP